MRFNIASVLLVTCIGTSTLTGCEDGPGETKPGTVEDSGIDESTVDDDGDAYYGDEDCDDNDSSVNPGATEICDDIDNDCDGEIDEDVQTTYYADNDGDGFGDPDSTTEACTNPDGYVPNGNDCDDDSDEAYPGGTETCDGVDNDCDGEIDEDVSETYYTDADGDGYGDPDNSANLCELENGYTTDNTDCDDTTDDAWPGNVEICDEVDNDCDGDTDEGVTSTYYADKDDDEFGDPASTEEACSLPTGYTTQAGDCDDDVDTTNPDADEVCDEADNDCDGDIDEDSAIDATTWYFDYDEDGFGDEDTSHTSCVAPTKYVDDDTDCDDADEDVNPDEDEVCTTAYDDDCDGDINEDEAVDASTWYYDADDDDFGDPDVSTPSCEQPAEYVSDDTDCDDGDDDIHPDADETCETSDDDDCDGEANEDDAVDALTWFYDADGDGYGDEDSTTEACEVPTDYVEDDTDCDDTDADVNPGEDEVCSTDYDDDCDGDVNEDDASDASTWYEDDDEDGYGDEGDSTEACEEPSGYVGDDTDCDDGDEDIFPGADEVCNEEDDDCDGDTDEEPTDGDTWYIDNDGDGMGYPEDSTVSCDQPSGYADNYYDCDDEDDAEPFVADPTDGSASGSGTWDDPLDSLQDAIDYASYCVIALPGTYREQVDFGGKSVDLWGVDGPSTTYIDASLSTCTSANPTECGPAVTIASGSGAEPTIHGFTITGGTGSYEASSTSESCADSSASYAGTTTCTIEVYEYCGGGVFVDGDNPTFSNVVIENNILPEFTQDATGDFYQVWMYSYGGGVCAKDAVIDFETSESNENFADVGGGMYIDDYSVVTFSQGQVQENSATDGAGIALNDADLQMSNGIIACNEAETDGGGLFTETSGDTELVNVVFFENSSSTSGSDRGNQAYVGSDTTLSMVNSIAYSTEDAYMLYGVGSGSFSYNDIYSSYGYTYAGTFSAGSDDITSDPEFEDASCDGNPANDDFSLSEDSPAIDAGDPSSDYDDADGTTNDMGAYGGPGGEW